jgi:peptidoglycan/LPS O-acetylase OafA/YrhL
MPLSATVKNIAAPKNLSVPAGSVSIHLDALRGVAAVGVLLNHWRDLLFMDYPQIHSRNPLTMVAYLFTGLGHQCVIVFFVLSGYLVGGSVLRQIAANSWTWGDYALTRLTRLYTVLIPALILGGLIDYLGLRLFGDGGIYGGHTGAHEIAGGIAARLSLPILFGNYLFLQAIFFPVLGSNGPLWSLSYEFWYYTVFPLSIFVFWRKANVAPRLVSVFLLVVVIIFLGNIIALGGLIWLMGAAIHWLPVRKPKTAVRGRMLFGAIFLVTILTLAWCKESHSRMSDFVLGVVVTALVYVILSCAPGRLPPAYTYLSQYMAKSSYTLYLVHVPALVFIAAWMGQQRWQPDGRHLLFALGILGAVFLYAQIVYLLFERNTGAIRRWLKRRRTKSSPRYRTG